MNKIFFLLLFIHCSLLSTKAPLPSSQELTKIAEKIWNNECRRSKEQLTCWRDGEDDFASVGICHFIWYPSGKEPHFTQTFPNFLTFVKDHKRPIPPYLTFCHACPWKTREEFYNKFYSKEMIELRDFLYNTIDLQMLFHIQRFQTSLPLIMMQTGKNSHIQHNINLLTQTAQGWYLLLDYLNFKGEGINPQERYNGTGWGLLQVLQNMKPSSSSTDAIKEFANAARTVIKMRVVNAPTTRKDFEKKWLQGWLNRIETYTSVL